jgi:hypothetical protein
MENVPSIIGPAEAFPTVDAFWIPIRVEGFSDQVAVEFVGPHIYSSLGVMDGVDGRSLWNSRLVGMKTERGKLGLEILDCRMTSFLSHQLGHDSSMSPRGSAIQSSTVGVQPNLLFIRQRHDQLLLSKTDTGIL